MVLDENVKHHQDSYNSSRCQHEYVHQISEFVKTFHSKTTNVSRSYRAQSKTRWFVIIDFSLLPISWTPHYKILLIYKGQQSCVSITMSVDATLVHVQREESEMLVLHCLGQSIVTKLQNENKVHLNPRFNLSGGLTLKEVNVFKVTSFFVVLFLHYAPWLRSEDQPSGPEPCRGTAREKGHIGA